MENKHFLRNYIIDVVNGMLLWVAAGFIAGVILTLLGITSFF